MSQMSIFSVIFIAWCIFWKPPLIEAKLMHTILDRFNQTLTDLNDSVEIFTSLLAFVPMEGMGNSVKVIKSIHQTTFGLVHDIYKIIKPTSTTDDSDDEDTDDKLIRTLFRETDKLLSYSEGLKNTLQKLRDFVLGINTKELSPLLPIGPPRVYKIYVQRNTDTSIKASNKTDFDELIQNVENAVDAETESVKTIAHILLQLPLDNIWGTQESVVQDVIDTLIDSLRKTLQEVKTTASAYDFGIYDSFIISDSKTIRVQVEAIKDSVVSLSRHIFL